MTVRTQPLIDPPVETLTDTERRARILEAAALEIEVRGWCQGQREDNEGRVCAIGGLMYAMGVGDNETESWLPVWGHGAEPVCESSLYLPAHFNDLYARSAADVTFLFRWRAQELRDLEGAAS